MASVSPEIPTAGNEADVMLPAYACHFPKNSTGTVDIVNPSASLTWPEKIRTAMPLVNPTTTGCGTNFATAPSRSQPNSICSAPIRTTQQEIVASSTARCPGRDSGWIAGSVLKVATAAAKSSMVAELRPAAGMALRPITATTKPPTSDAAPPASMPTGAAEFPSATNASKGSVSQLASVTTEPMEPATTSARHAAARARAATGLRLRCDGVSGESRTGCGSSTGRRERKRRSPDARAA